MNPNNFNAPIQQPGTILPNVVPMATTIPQNEIGYAQTGYSTFTQGVYPQMPYTTQPIYSTQPVYSTQPQVNVNLNHTHGEGMLNKLWRAIAGCSTCKGLGRVYVNGAEHYCYDCSRQNKYCPNCNNTGWLGNSRCMCGLY